MHDYAKVTTDREVSVDAGSLCMHHSLMFIVGGGGCSCRDTV